LRQSLSLSPNLEGVNGLGRRCVIGHSRDPTFGTNGPRALPAAVQL